MITRSSGREMCVVVDNDGNKSKRPSYDVLSYIGNCVGKGEGRHDGDKRA